jgi:hypothetical protein
MRLLWGQWKQHGATLSCRSTMMTEPLFVVATRVTVRNGRVARFWTTPWVHRNTLARMFPMLFRHSLRKNRTVAEAMARETWIRDLMHEVTTDIFVKYIMLWLVIDEISFDSADQRADEIVWTRTASGQYSARSAYLMQFQGSLESDFENLIWQVWVSSRCTFFV